MSRPLQSVPHPTSTPSPTCSRVDPDLGHQPSATALRVFRGVCRSCPLLTTCVDRDLSSTPDTSVLGGLTDAERAALFYAEQAGDRADRAQAATLLEPWWVGKLRYAAKTCPTLDEVTTTIGRVENRPVSRGTIRLALWWSGIDVPMVAHGTHGPAHVVATQHHNFLSALTAAHAPDTTIADLLGVHVLSIRRARALATETKDAA
ncbi:WhiB family transcriptional regulator [Streptomyces sp. NPDC003011]